MEVPELIEQEVSPGVVGLVADDDTVGVAGDDGGDSYLPQADCLGLPAFGGGAGQGQAAGIVLAVVGHEVVVVGGAAQGVGKVGLVGWLGDELDGSFGVS
mgnify:CR=1 FL=1